MITLKGTSTVDIEGNFLVSFDATLEDGRVMPQRGGILMSARHASLVPRMIAATNAGKLFVGPQLLKDIYGVEYVNATCVCRPRHMNAELRRLGF